MQIIATSTLREVQVPVIKQSITNIDTIHGRKHNDNTMEAGSSLCVCQCVFTVSVSFVATVILTTDNRLDCRYTSMIPYPIEIA